MAELEVHVAYHDAGPHPRPGDGPYLAVCNVAADGSRPPGFPAYDDEGGFPERNAAYCELSVLRRLQARSTATYVGLAHYRRLLVARRPAGRRGDQPGTFHVPRWDWAEVDGHGAGTAALLAAVAGLDWCTPQPYDVRRAGFRSLEDQFVANHPVALLDAAADALATTHPSLPPLREHLRRARALPLYNVFVGRRTVLEDYASFLWPVLEEAARRWQPQPHEAYQRRWAGFLAERLHGYWLEHVGTPAGVRLGTLPLALLGDGGRSSAGPGPRSVLRATLPPPVLLRMHGIRSRGRA